MRTACCEHAHQISVGRRQDADHLGEGRLQARDDHALQLRAPGKPREHLHVLRAERPSADERAEDLQRLQRARLVDEALRELDLVPGGRRDRGGAREERAQPALAGLLGRARKEAVLHDVVLDAARTEPPPQLLELSALEAAELGPPDQAFPAGLTARPPDLPALSAYPPAFRLALGSGL